MERFKQHWLRIHVSVRKPLVLIVGLSFVIVSPFAGILPGPGGIPIFLVGIAILSTEFVWAQRFRDWLLHKLRQLGELWRGHKVMGSLIGIFCLVAASMISVYVYHSVKNRS